MADNTEFRQHIIRDWRDALDAVRRAGASTIAVDVTAMAIILDAALTPPSAPDTRRRALADLTHEAIDAGSYGEPAPKMRPASDTAQGRPMKLTLSMDPHDPLCRRLMVDGRQVGLVNHHHSGWVAGLWPVADRRPRLDQGGPWWTVGAPESTEETDHG